jgi:prepilin-type N-terminal cleavage/methylation domain-containing protein
MLRKKLGRKAFTLVELSITLLIAGIIATGYLSYKQFNTKYALVNQTEEKLQVIEDALITFIAKNGRLPCPASPSQAITNDTFGKEQVTSLQPATCETNNTDIFTGDLSGDTLYYGTVPVRSLGLSDDFMFDAWTNRIGYVVQQAFINDINTNPTCIAGSLAQDLHTNDNLCYRGQASGSVNPVTPDVEIRDSYNGNILSGDPVYVLISHGENGYGAFRYSSDRDVDGIGAPDGSNTNRNSYPPSSHDNEQANLECNPITDACNSTGLTTQYIQSKYSANFDDIVVFKTRNQLLADCNSYLNNECTSTHDIQTN